MQTTPKLIVLLALLAPVLLAQKKAEAAQKKPQSLPSQPVAPAQPVPVSAPNDGATVETPNQQRRRLNGQGVPSPQEYPFSDAMDALQGTAPPAAAQRLIWARPPQTGAKKAEPFIDFGPKVPPPATATDAITLSDRWQNTRDSPAEGRDGRIVFSDGAGLPTIVCAPLHLCIVELQPGEKLNGEPHIGDSVRWRIEPANYGPAEMPTAMIVIKPTAAGLGTDLVITTDRRSYYLRLISSAKEYVAKTAFDYPDDSRAEWARALKNQGKDVPNKTVPTVADSVEALNVDYRVSGDSSIRPARVLDDGVHTYIQMNSAVLLREAPVLLILGPEGKAEMVNYRVQGSVYVVDRLFDRGRLVLGSGRKARKADIVRGSVKNRRPFAHDPFENAVQEDRKVEVNPQ